MLKHLSNLKKSNSPKLLLTIVAFLFTTGCGGGSSETTMPTKVNSAPIAQIKDVVVVNDLTISTLDGSLSSDSDGEITKFSWKQVDNEAPEAKITSPTSSITEIELPDVKSKTIFEFQLEVIDNSGAKSTDSTTLEVKDVNCLDYSENIPASGIFSTDFSAEMVPGCNGDIYIANKELMQIDWVNVVSGETIETFQLISSPKQLEFDHLQEKLYVTFYNINQPENYYAVIDRNEMTVEYVTLDFPITMLTLNKNGGVFISSRNQYFLNYDVYKIEGDEVVGGPWSIDVPAIRYNHTNNQIIAADYGVSPASLYRYGFDENGNISMLEHLRTDGANGNDLEISNDGSIVVLAAGGGNGHGYDILNFDSTDLSNVRGKWDVGAYPNSVSFSYDDSMLATTNYTSLVVYNTSTYQEILKKEILPCPYNDLFHAEFSRNGKMVFVKQDCLIEVNGQNDRVNYIHYFKIPENT
ncbi:PKD domain-containing protein [Thalassotalea sediminis]|uniref:PKD domain-containing protein n=1 Tax=Thalassotalea sediminis TaxID=1759089 RepID=UPI00257361CF|nr:hypothetical protein [Thalassotalea sediminis]